jgi:hypothetical protein
MDLKTISGINIKTIKITRINIEPLEKDVEITKSKNLNLFNLNYYFDFGFYLCLIPFKFKPLSKKETLSTHFKCQIYKHKLQKVNLSCVRKADLCLEFNWTADLDFLDALALFAAKICHKTDRIRFSVDDTKIT